MFYVNKIIFSIFIFSFLHLRSNESSFSSDSITFQKRIKIVILPPKVILNDLKLNSLDIKSLESIEKSYIELYQKILESELYYNLKKNSYIDNTLNTNQKLKDSGIDTKNIWAYPLNELARILNADLVYFLKIEQKSFLSNFEYYNLNLNDLSTITNLYTPVIIENAIYKKTKLSGELSVFSAENLSISYAKNSIKINKTLSAESNIRKLILKLIKSPLK
jgi:hypothetical protein